MRGLRLLFTTMGVAALVGPAAVAGDSAPASASTRPTIAALAMANIGKKACSINSQHAKAFESSCTGNGGQPEYWCADFARWVWSQAGVADTSRLNALAGSFYTYGKDYGTLSSVPAVGDAAVFNFNGTGNADHVAIVTGVSANGTITTVSGDWNGQSGTEAQFASTSTVVLNAPAFLGVVGTTPGVMGMTISAFVAPVGVRVVPVVGEASIASGQTLASGTSLISPDGHYSLVMQSDGNLVEEMGTRVLWTTGTSGQPGARAIMRADGDLVVASPSNVILWASHTGGRSGSFSLSLRDDGALLVNGPTGLLWSEKPQIDILRPGQSLLSGQRLVSSDGLYSLNMQSDGNLVEYTAGRVLWATGTVRHQQSRAVMQTDGNFVVYGSTNVATWSSGTGGHSGSSLVLMAGGSLNVDGPSGQMWTNHV